MKRKTALLEDTRARVLVVLDVAIRALLPAVQDALGVSVALDAEGVFGASWWH